MAAQHTSASPFAPVAASLGAVRRPAAALALLLAAPAPALAQDASPPERHAAVVYLHGGPVGEAPLFDALKDLGFDAVNVSSGADPRTPGANGMGFYLDQPAGKGFLELRTEHWDKIRDAYERDRDPTVLVRPTSLAAGPDRVAARELLLERVRAAAPLGPIGIAVADEPSTTKGTSPLDFDLSEASLRGFRQYLAERYADVDALNRAWGSTWASIDGAEPFLTERIRRRELRGEGFPLDLAAWNDHRAYCDGEFADAVRALCDAARQASGGIPSGLTGMQPPAAFGGYDYGLLMPAMDFYEAYDIGGARDLAMSMAADGALRLETLGAPPPDAGPRWVLARWADFVAHGAAAVVVWSSGDVLRTVEPAREDAQPVVEPTPFGRQVKTALATLRPLADACAGAAVRRDPVWLVESQASVRAWWMLDSADDGDSWVRRLSSYEAEHSTSQAVRRSWVRLLEDLGLQGRWVAARDLPQRLAARPPKVLVLPACLALADEEVAAIQAFVAAGGTLLADHSPGLYDGELRLREQAALDELFGITGRSPRAVDLLVREGQAADRGRLDTGGAAAEMSIRGGLAEPHGDFHVHVESQFGSGSAVYLNMAVAEYAALRLDTRRVAAARDYRRRARHVLHRAGVKPPADVRGADLPTCIERLRLRTPSGRDLLVVRLNTLDDPGLTRTLCQRKAVDITLTLPFPRALRDLRTGRTFEPGTEFEFSFDPAVGLFLEFTGGGG